MEAIAQKTSNSQLPSKTKQTGNRSNKSGNLQVKIPVKKLPARREAGSTRRGSCISGDPALLALLLPATNLGLTSAAYPRFFWYSPKNTALQTKFSLYKIDERSRQQTLLYNTTFKPSTEAGVTSLALPNQGKTPPLEINQTYYWTVSIICDLTDSSPRSVISVDGWIQRVALTQNVTNQLQQLNPKERISIYAEQGLWFDTLSTVAELRACNPSDKNLSNLWINLLQQAELVELAQQPLQQECSRP
ncbi:DUF928 domain-containing protein [Chlorogloeopsis sp. ULAP01]|uniref:DUF928 domain-containing protein n=1 Tax=Chlorogloeopsis sp. ULAP01 TaxID=3056483 RepID=UPI0025AB3C8E|nr:DUF928 domain-containing protein [Chlorogloeopsis sp. ULAP01]MDM9380430.1 DUF928 domain-containing protein [Chlorogloeopsis sp. ULAP01]